MKQIRYDNTYRENIREEKQAILDGWNIIHGFPEILFRFCKLDINEYRDIYKKWLGAKKRDDIKGPIGGRELGFKDGEWNISKEKLHTFPRTGYLSNCEIIQWNPDKKIE
jgi:hypothetical protein